MERDLEIFPDDENGNVLWRMHQNGDNLSKRRTVDFAVIFPTKAVALQFAVHLLENGQKVSFSAYEGDDEQSWQVEAHSMMMPTHEEITRYEAQLGADG